MGPALCELLGAELADVEVGVADEMLDDVMEPRDCAPLCDVEVDILGTGIHLAPPTHDTGITTHNCATIIIQ